MDLAPSVPLSFLLYAKIAKKRRMIAFFGKLFGWAVSRNVIGRIEVVLEYLSFSPWLTVSAWPSILWQVLFANLKVKVG